MTSSFQSKEAAKIIARSSVKRMILEHLIERGGMMPSELAGLLGTKLPNITIALKDLSKHYLIYQTNPGSTKGKVYVLSELGLAALSELRNTTRTDLIHRFWKSSFSPNSKGRVLSSSSSQMECIFDVPIRQWDYVSGKFRFDTRTYVTVGIINEVQVHPRIQVNGTAEEADERVPPSYLVNVIILGQLSDEETVSYAPIIPIGNSVDIASEEHVRLVLGLRTDISGGITLGTTLGRPHFPVTLSAAAFNIMIGDIPRRYQIEIASRLIMDLKDQGLVLCITRKPDDFKNLNGLVMWKLEEFQKAHLDALYKEVEDTGDGKFLVIDSSSPSRKVQYPEWRTMDSIIKYLGEVQTRGEKEHPNANYLGMPVSLILDEADRFFVHTDYGLISKMFEKLIDDGRSYFYHQIFITRSPFLSHKILRMTATLLIGSSSISALEVLQDTKVWERQNMFEEPIRKMLDIHHLSDSDYLLLNASLEYPILMTASDQRDILEKEMELKEQLFLMTNKTIKGVDRNIRVQGVTMKHRFDLSFRKNNEEYLIKYEHIDQAQSVNQLNQATEWVFPTIDITSSSYKLVFVYSGHIGSGALKILKYYYDEVMPFDKFKEFLSQS